MANSRKYINRFVWVYLSVDKRTGKSELFPFVSPDQYSITLGLPTPYKYRLVHDHFVYHLNSEVELSKETAKKLCSELLTNELSIPKNLRRKQRR